MSDALAGSFGSTLQGTVHTIAGSLMVIGWTASGISSQATAKPLKTSAQRRATIPKGPSTNIMRTLGLYIYRGVLVWFGPSTLAQLLLSQAHRAA